MNKKSLGWVLVLTAFSAAAVAWWYQGQRDRLPPGVLKSNGRLEVERIEISAKYPGRITEIAVHEGDEVKAGDLIAQQDLTEILAQRMAAEAARQRATQAIARAQAETDARKVQARLAQLELDHTAHLRQDNLVSSAEVERRQAQRDGEHAGVRAATAAIGEATAARSEAEAQIQRINAVIADMSLRTPVSGRVEYRVVEPGSILPSGGRVATLLNTSDVHMTVFLPTSVVGRLKVGDDARIVLDALPNYTFPAQISFVAAEAQFTPKYVETSVERDKLVYRVKLKIPREVAHQFTPYVKAGLTGNGYVRTEPTATWPQRLTIKLPELEKAAAQ